MVAFVTDYINAQTLLEHLKMISLPGNRRIYIHNSLSFKVFVLCLYH